MARREWAERIVEDLEFIAVGGDRVCESKDVLNVLTKEHARAVRIIQKIKRRHSNAQENAIYSHGFTKACEDILRALKEGRA